MEITLSDKEKETFETLLKIAKENDTNTVLRVAGGWVRDKLFGKESFDIDIALNNISGEKFSNIVANKLGLKPAAVIKSNPEKSKHLETATLRINGLDIDFTNLRTESYTQDSRIPETKFGTPEEDARRRDLTINALFYNINTGLIEDYVGGIEDIKNKIARTPNDCQIIFNDDPLRILRVIRFACRFDLTVKDEIIDCIKDMFVIYNPSDSNFIFDSNKLSAERVTAELFGYKTKSGWKAGIINGPNITKIVYLLRETNVINLIADDNFHTLHRLIYINNENQSPERILIKVLSLICLSHYNRNLWLDKNKFANILPKNIKNRVNDIVFAQTYTSKFKKIKYITRERILITKEDWDILCEIRYIMKILASPITYLNYDDNILGKTLKEYKETYIKEIVEMGGIKATLPIDGNDLIALNFTGKKVGEALDYAKTIWIKKPDITKEQMISLIKLEFVVFKIMK